MMGSQLHGELPPRAVSVTVSWLVTGLNRVAQENNHIHRTVLSALILFDEQRTNQLSSNGAYFEPIQMNSVPLTNANSASQI